MNTTAEEWRPIAGYEGIYEVSSRGRVRSLDRTLDQGNCVRQMRGKILSGGKRKSPRKRFGAYRTVDLYDHGARSTRYVHRLVAKAFIGPGGPGLEVCHKDDNGSNNVPSNLYWGTRSQNLYDAVRNRTQAAS